jgi:hypothetical protein
MMDDEYVDLPATSKSPPAEGDEYVDLPIPGKPGQAKSEPIIQRIARWAEQNTPNNIPGQFLLGGAKGIGSTAQGIGHLLGNTPSPEAIPELQGTNLTQKIGKGAEQFGEFFVPMGGEAKALKLLEQFPWLAKLGKELPAFTRALEKGAVTGASTGLVSTAQTGDLKQGITTGVLTGAMAGLGEPVKDLLGALGHKIQLSTIRPSLSDYKAYPMLEGFSPELLQKLNLRGNLRESLGQVIYQLSKLRTERSAVLGATATPQMVNGVMTGGVDLVPAIGAARQQLVNQAAQLKNAGMSKKALDAFDNLIKDMQFGLKQNPTGFHVSIDQAENAKEAIGLLGQWAYGARDVDSSSMGQAANILYTELRKAIERAVPDTGKLKALNAAMKELIPVKNAMLHRLPVEERNRLFSLADITAILPAIISGRMEPLSLLALTRAQKSLSVGNWLVSKSQESGSSGIPRALAAILSKYGSQ